MNSKTKIIISTVIRFILCLFLAVAVPIFTVVFLFAQNATEVYLSEIFRPMLRICLVSILVFVPTLLITRSLTKSALSTAFFSLMLCNFTSSVNLLKRFIPIIKYPQVVVIMIFAFVVVFLLLLHARNTELLYNLVKLFSLAFFIITAFNLSNAAIVKAKIAKPQVNDLPAVSQTDTILPNIYYIVLDEYTDFDILKQYVNYDNDAFKDFLEQRNFHVSQTSENNYHNTATVMTGILSLEYMPPADGSLTEYAAKRNNSKLYELLRAKGYTLRGLGEWDFLGLPPAIDKNLRRSAATLEGVTFEQLVSLRTPLPQNSTFEQDRMVIEKSLAFFNYDANYTKSNTFTMMHLNSPHLPNIFNADGSRTSTETLFNNYSPEPYINQLKFITSATQKVIDEILKRDPDSIILLQSDHSGRDRNLAIPRECWYQILNAGYYRGAPFTEIDGKSGLNSVISLLNKLLDANLELKEMPAQRNP